MVKHMNSFALLKFVCAGVIMCVMCIWLLMYTGVYSVDIRVDVEAYVMATDVGYV